METTSQVLGKHLKEERLNMGLSHVKLSAILKEKYGVNISKDSLINYEVIDAAHTKAGSNVAMRAEYLYCLADFYGVSVDYLLGLNEVRSTDIQVKGDCQYTGLSEAAVQSIKQDCTKCDHDGKRYLAFLNSLLVDPNFRYLITTLYRFTTANEAKTVYDKMNQDFYERQKKGEIEDHSEYTEEILRHAKRTDLHDEVRGMFLVQAKLNNLNSPIIQELAKDTPDANIGDIYRLEAMRAFNDLLDEETGSPCYKKINP